MKKLTGLIAVIMLFSIVFAGCGTKKDSSAEATTTEGESETEKPAGDKNAADETKKELPFVTLKLYMVGDEPVDTPKVMDEINKYLKQKINAEIDMTVIPGSDRKTKYPMLLASGEEFDMAFTAKWNYLSEASNGAYMELTDEMLQKYAPNIWADTSDMEWAIGTFDGKKYMINKQETEFDDAGWGYREDIRVKYEVPELVTWDDFEAYLKAIKENETSMIPWNTNEIYIKVFNASNELVKVSFDFIAYDLKSNKSIKVYEHPNFLEFAKRMRKWYEAGYWSKNILSSKVDGRSEFENGRSGVFAQNVRTQETIAPGLTKDMGWEIGFAPYYGLNGGEPARVRKVSGKAGISLYYNCPNPERSLMFLDLQRSDPYLYSLFHYGIKGVHYDVDAEGYRVTPEGVNASEVGYIDSYSVWGLRDDDMKIPVRELWPVKTQMYEKYETNFYNDPLITFNLDQNPVKTELAACTNAWTTYGVALLCGVVDPVEGLEVLKEQMENAGIDKVQSEIQRQLDKHN